MAFAFENITTLQVDCTSYCNSFCGECARNIEGGEVNPLLPLQHMTMDMWRNITADNSLENITKIIFNGNFGDICMHPDIINILKYVHSIKPSLIIQIHTNGSNRTTTFWKELSDVLKEFESHEVIFGIDGLKDTSARYRRGTNFDTAIRNAKVMIDNDSFVTWRYIVFDHNDEQIREAFFTAKDLGFTRFTLNRSVNPKIKMKSYKNFPEDEITAPGKEKIDWLNSFASYNKKREMYDSMEYQGPYLLSNCPWESQRQVQIDFLGRVLPCCYFSMLPIKKNPETGKVYGSYKWLQDRYDEYEDFNDLNKNSLRDILSHKFYTDDLPDIWKTEGFGVCNKCQGKTVIKQ